MSSWDVNPAPEREWAVENRIPMYQPHLTTGHGAIGQITPRTNARCRTCTWEAVAWDGSQAGAGYLSRCRRRSRQLHRRLEAILRHYGASFGDIEGGLHLLSYVGEDCLLG